MLAEMDWVVEERLEYRNILGGSHICHINVHCLYHYQNGSEQLQAALVSVGRQLLQGRKHVHIHGLKN